METLSWDPPLCTLYPYVDHEEVSQAKVPDLWGQPHVVEIFVMHVNHEDGATLYWSVFRPLRGVGGCATNARWDIAYGSFSGDPDVDLSHVVDMLGVFLEGLAWRIRSGVPLDMPEGWNAVTVHAPYRERSRRSDGKLEMIILD